jgi:hypothetical protein
MTSVFRTNIAYGWSCLANESVGIASSMPEGFFNAVAATYAWLYPNVDPNAPDAYYDLELSDIIWRLRPEFKHQCDFCEKLVPSYNIASWGDEWCCKACAADGC